MYTFRNIYISRHMSVCACMYAYMSMYLCMYVCRHIYVCPYIHILSLCMHTYVHVCKCT